MKKLTKLVLPVVLLVGLIVGYRLTQDKPEEVLADVVTLQIVVEEEVIAEVTQEIKEEVTVGELIDTLNGEVAVFILEGEKDSEWGRYISGINEYITEDMDAGPWWFLSSDTNQDCLDLGFCNGIDSQGMSDKDIFILSYE